MIFLDISEEVQEQAELVRAQLRRATEIYGGPLNSNLLCGALSQSLAKDINPFQPDNTFIGSLHVENTGNIDNEGGKKFEVPVEGINGSVGHPSHEIFQESESLRNLCTSSDGSGYCGHRPDLYERPYIQRWINWGNTCPKTQQNLQHLTLTPNFVLRSLISQWDIEAFKALVRKLSSWSIEQQMAAMSEIRSLSKRSTDNRILLAEAGAMPVLVNQFTSDDAQIQENAVTSILNLSIYDNKKGLIMQFLLWFKFLELEAWKQ
ncbi:U-box domain-containing 11-like [Olea europaea subsp. europaea]|uniref:RING-type E3 ubiquitin transferase n=1 Tax=Olea europaea subsp. europaea TaxID=158383 RepID=A0A8S0S0S7_OLEEU|nr:U-box domain-containing 11-like [Olea europaea subsp. europaea]